ncbi:MAG: GH3 auxin-responsive promoter family protein [Dysgonamonadaceae bacterium]|jgi:hypothetical protein|nr:GH3 auxin-responsive promoter family protein [Dysgonamonadaceae bacterium]
MILEKAALYFFQSRLQSIEYFGKNPGEVQKSQLQNLIMAARSTEWGVKYDYASIRTYSDFASRVPVQSYEDIKSFIQRMIEGESNILWAEKIGWFAKSSGTTNDKSKYIPVSPASLDQCHYRGGLDTVVVYLNNRSNSKLFEGKGLILGGSHKPVFYNQYVKTGDLSAILIENINPVANLVRTPSKKIILMDEWESKLEAICTKTHKENVTNLSGVPSWFLVLIKKILEKTEKKYLTDIWPNLEVFFHGGVSFVPYKQQYKELIPSPNMIYMETYNASEGFFALQNDFSDQAMLLMLDYGVFYEFIPIEDVESNNPKTFLIEDVELNRNYAVVISSNNGLWRYKLGDTVKFTSKYPHKIVVTGRTRNYINAFGEELMVDNADSAIQKACETTGAKVSEYTAAPVYMSSEMKGRHQWLIEFDRAPESVELFTSALDAALQELNSDYEAKRYKNITLEMPEITIARKGLFHDWLKKKNKMGGQHKVPRLNNTRDVIEDILRL